MPPKNIQDGLTVDKRYELALHALKSHPDSKVKHIALQYKVDRGELARRRDGTRKPARKAHGSQEKLSPGQNDA